MTRVAIYTRVSTQDQAQEGFSLPAQLERLRAYCLSQDWEISGTYTDEGESAKTTDRPELQRMINDIKMKNIDVVLVYRLDRLTRSVLDLYDLLQTFDDHHVGFKSATEVFDTTTAMGRLFITIVAALAQWERENLGERVVFGSRQKAMTGQVVTPKELFGYNLVNGEFKINEEEAEIVKVIFNKYVSGEGIIRILRWLNDREAPRLGRKISHWSQTSLRYLLQHPFYAGYIRYDHTSKSETIIVKGDHPAIISEELYRRVIEVKESRKGKGRTGTGRFPLAGLLKCHCGSAMRGSQTTLKGKTYRYYQCLNARINRCSWKTYKADEIEQTFLNKLDELVHTLSKEISVTEEKQKSVDTHSLIKKIEEKRRRLWDAYEAGLTPLDALKKRLERLNTDEDKIKKEGELLISKVNKKAVIQSLSTTRDIWNEANALEQKELVRSIIERIDMDINGELNIIIK